jgi:hypothetical protein
VAVRELEGGHLVLAGVEQEPSLAELRAPPVLATQPEHQQSESEGWRASGDRCGGLFARR